MSNKIKDVDQMDNGIIVNFEDGICALFDADFLYAQTDKRVQVDADDSSSAPPPQES